MHSLSYIQRIFKLQMPPVLHFNKMNFFGLLVDNGKIRCGSQCFYDRIIVSVVVLQ